MSQQEAHIRMLNELIRINLDRSAGYRKALTFLSANDIDLATLFSNVAETSRLYAEILSDHVKALGVDPLSGSAMPGNLNRTWMDFRSDGTNDRKSILSRCEAGEDVILRAYTSALESGIAMPDPVVELITDQKEKLQQEHDLIKRLRDMQAAVNS